MKSWMEPASAQMSCMEDPCTRSWTERTKGEHHESWCASSGRYPASCRRLLASRSPCLGKFCFRPSIVLLFLARTLRLHTSLPAMTLPTVTPSHVRTALLLREEIALLDVRHEAAFATGHPLFAANMAAERILLEAETRLPRKDVPIVLYDAGEGLVTAAAERLAALGYTDVRQLDGGLLGWREAGYELFQDVNSYAKAFGELV